MSMNVSEMDERVKQMALKLYEEKAIKVSCERCFIVTSSYLRFRRRIKEV